ncbi:MAG TPA: ParA family protein [Terriglobia bacterium]|nr:ParA family protein [Terriglobia bacterium]
MIKLTIANQRGGVGKTITALTLARYMSEAGKKVLVVDTDSQGSIRVALKLQPSGWLHQLVDNQVGLSEVITKTAHNVDVICSDRRSQRIESILNSAVAREMTFYGLLAAAEPNYDAILFDVSPSICNLQSCAIAYTKNVLIPVAMDSLSIEGAMASLQSIEVLNRLMRLGCQCVGFLPTMMDRRTSATEVVLHTLDVLSKERNIKILHGIRTDQSVNKALRLCKFLFDFDPKSRALEDYQIACKQLLEVLEPANVEAQQITVG